MPIGMQNVTNVTLDQLNNMSNVTDPVQFLTNVNDLAFGGIYVFIALWVLAIIFYMAAQEFKDQPLNNAMYAMAICSVVALFARVIGLLTDHLMWIFPLITILLATLIWAIRRDDTS